LGKGGLAQKPNKKESLWLITDKGHETLENPPANWVRNLTEKTSEENFRETSRQPPEELTVHSRADLFRDIGDRLRAGIGKSGKQESTPLEAIIYFAREISWGHASCVAWNLMHISGCNVWG